MSATVELNFFSGFRNITWRLDDQESKNIHVQIVALPLKPDGFHPVHGYTEPLGRPRSGYRGVTIAFSAAEGSGIYDVYGKYVFDYQLSRVRLDSLQQLAKQILGAIPMQIVANVLNGLTVEQILLPGQEALIKGITGTAREALCEHAPEYIGDTGEFKTFRARNNCYNYATSVVNQLPARQAIPGSPNVGPPLTTAKLKAALIDDGLVFLGDELPDTCPSEGNRYVAILLRHHPTGQVRDFHCLRLDRTGRWSHKDGSGEVRNVDDNGNVITDIKTAALSWDPDLVGFFRFNDADKGHIG